jgi:hypothetical protein
MSEETHFLKLKRVAAALPFVAAIRATCSLVRYSMSASVKLHRSNVNYNQRRLWADLIWNPVRRIYAVFRNGPVTLRGSERNEP